MRRLSQRSAVVVAICAASLGGLACGSSGSPSAAGRVPIGLIASTSTGSPSAPKLSAGSGRSVRHSPSAGSTQRVRRNRPITPATGSGAETAAFTQTVLPLSTPIRSTEYHYSIVKAVVAAGKGPRAAEVIAGCMQKVLEEAHIETVGAADKLKRDPTGDKQVGDGALQCLGSAAP